MCHDICTLGITLTRHDNCCMHTHCCLSISFSVVSTSCCRTRFFCRSSFRDCFNSLISSSRKIERKSSVLAPAAAKTHSTWLLLENFASEYSHWPTASGGGLFTGSGFCCFCNEVWCKSCFALRVPDCLLFAEESVKSNELSDYETVFLDVLMQIPFESRERSLRTPSDSGTSATVPGDPDFWSMTMLKWSSKIAHKYKYSESIFASLNLAQEWLCKPLLSRFSLSISSWRFERTSLCWFRRKCKLFSKCCTRCWALWASLLKSLSLE